MSSKQLCKPFANRLLHKSKATEKTLMQGEKPHPQHPPWVYLVPGRSPAWVCPLSTRYRHIPDTFQTQISAMAADGNYYPSVVCSKKGYKRKCYKISRALLLSFTTRSTFASSVNSAALFLQQSDILWYSLWSNSSLKKMHHKRSF